VAGSIRISTATIEARFSMLTVRPSERRAFHRHGRYLVLCRDLPGEDAVRVERVLHSARNLPRLL